MQHSQEEARRGSLGMRTLGVLGALILILCPQTLAAEFITSQDILSQEPLEPDFRVSYGKDPLQFGELRIPEGDGPHPIAVVIHGGCWLPFASLKYLDRFAEALTNAGIATWNIEYRRVDSSGGGWPNTFLDVGKGVDHLRALAPRHDLDLDRVVVVGHSSGGHVSLWAAGRSRVPKESPLYMKEPLPLLGAVSLAGPGDLAAFRPQDNDVCGMDVIDELMKGSPADSPAHY